jgi:hypothetical protein
MVFFYTLPPKAHARGFRVYMGRDKHENEDLLKYGWKEDVWFHVEGISSAHVYLRLPEGVEWDKIPAVVMKFCCQLVKNNSIDGCKKKECWVIYTPFPNLHKDTNTMQTGAVSFHKESLRLRVLVEKDRELVRSIERTKEERSIDLAEELRMHEWEVLQKLKKERKQQAKEAERQKNIYKQKAYENSYDRLFEEVSVSIFFFFLEPRYDGRKEFVLLATVFADFIVLFFYFFLFVNDTGWRIESWCRQWVRRRRKKKSCSEHQQEVIRWQEQQQRRVADFACYGRRRVHV